MKSSAIIHVLILFNLACEDNLYRERAETGYDVEENAPAVSSKAVATTQEDISQSRRNAITNTVAFASPAVVGINVTEVREYRYVSPFLSDPILEYFFGLSRPSYKEKVKSLGSGFLISKDGYIVTNAHVIHNASEIVVTMTDETHYKARIIGEDLVTDIAVLKIEGDDFPHLKFGNSDDIIVGEWAIALGNPFGLFDINNKPTVTVGIISAAGLNFSNVKGRSYRGMIQTDASINTGNSGGPLLNAKAEVIGVNTFIYTGGGNGSIGIGFAIPINRVSGIVSELRNRGRVDRAFQTGISVQPIDPGLAAYFGLKSHQGFIITNVKQGSSGDKAGLKVGDVILEANGSIVNSTNSIVDAVRELRVGDDLPLKVLRGKQLLNIKVKLEKG